MFWKELLIYAGKELLEFIVSKIKEAIALKKKAKKDRAKVSQALKEKDAQKRAQNIRDILSS